MVSMPKLEGGDEENDDHDNSYTNNNYSNGDGEVKITPLRRHEKEYSHR